MTTISYLNYTILPNNETLVEIDSELYQEHIIAAAAIVIVKFLYKII